MGFWVNHSFLRAKKRFAYEKEQIAHGRSLVKRDKSESLPSLFKKERLSEEQRERFTLRDKIREKPVKKNWQKHTKNMNLFERTASFWERFARIASKSLMSLFFRVGNLLICSSLIRSLLFSLILLRTNKQLRANCSGRLGQKSNREQFPHVAHDKRANEQIAKFFGANRWFALSLTKNQWFAKKID